MADIVTTGAKAIVNRLTGAAERGAVTGERALGRMRSAATLPDGSVRLDNINAARADALRAMGKGPDAVHKAQLNLAQSALFNAGLQTGRDRTAASIAEARKLLMEGRGAAEMAIRAGGTMQPPPATVALAQRTLADIDSAIGRLGRLR